MVNSIASFWGFIFRDSLCLGRCNFGTYWVWKLVIVNQIVNLVVFSYVRYYFFRKIFCIIIHILLNIIDCHCDWSLDFRKEFLRLFYLGNWETELLSVYRSFICHHFLPLFFLYHFLRFLFSISIQTQRLRV